MVSACRTEARYHFSLLVQPDHFNTSSFLQERDIHTSRSLTFHQPVKRRITQEAAAITAGLTII